MFEAWILDTEDKNRLLVFSESDGYHGVMVLNYEHTDLYVGQKIAFGTNGIMTMSLPPIVTPTTLEVIDDQRYFVVYGLLKSIDNGLLVSTKNGDVLGKLDSNHELQEIVEGAPLYLFYDGRMTRSIPPQIWVEKVIQDNGIISRNDIETAPCE